MEATGFSSPRPDAFPAGLRVLVVDDDPTWLKILEKMLKKCSYEVTTCNLAREALDLLRERKDGFDIVISDVNMPDMDGFKLLEHVGLEMDLPVIMMSVDGETSRVMKGVQHGACDYLLKPIRMKELRNIWQHVYRKRIHEVRDIEGHESLEEIQMMRNGTEQFDDNFFNGDIISGKKRKDVDNKHDDTVCGDPSSVKKARVVWSVDLHQKFVKAVNQIGYEKVGPKKILDLMAVPWLTRENVASHLQKYRLYLSRLQKENEQKTAFGGIKPSDFSSKGAAASACLQNSVGQNSITVPQSAIANESYTVLGNKVPISNIDSKFEGDSKGILSMPMAESKRVQSIDSVDPPKSSTSRISFNHSFGPLDLDVNYEPKIQAQYSWNAEVPPIQLKQEHLQLPMHQIQIDSLDNSFTNNPGPSNKEEDKPTEIGFKPSFCKSRSQGTGKVTKVESIAALFSVQPESHLADCRAFETIQRSMWNSKNYSLEPNLFNNMESSQRNLVLETGSTFRLRNEELHGYSCHGDFHPLNGATGNLESFGNSNLEHIADVPPYSYDSLNFDTEYPSDLMEYPVIEQGLFIA